MDIFEFAMEKEQMAEQYYRKLSEDAPNKGLACIFNLLADEEHGHREVVAKMKEGVPADVADTVLLTNAKSVFARMREKGENIDFGTGQIALYKKAQAIESQSRDFYEEKAEQAEDERQKEIFKILAGEEKKHYFLLDNIIEFVSRPQSWLENAEFHHLEHY